MKNTKRITESLYFLAGILFVISAILGKNYVFIPIGCCFICLGIVHGSKRRTNPTTKSAKTMQIKRADLKIYAVHF
jgi:uncharacterized membrane protein HdeD (DUF308 family)